ncbi:hypothetical protein CHS0354_038331 [Potamilus streckersoni]|uniref:EGF-like domain-containing protein n=1 Tax=Potamilus streckersoni TaxID=2493646 RepID=A0AAE0S612_9BIVA|nr:hypothetical protein CHS0354_038331 [Potamilus streckersoni]
MIQKRSYLLTHVNVQRHNAGGHQKINHSESFLSTSNQNPKSWDNVKRLCICSNGTITRTQNLRNISVCSPDESVLCKRNRNLGKDVVRCPFYDYSTSIRSRRDLRTQEFTDRSSPVGIIRRRKSSISLERAISACDSFFALSPNYKLQNDLPVNTLNNSIFECALDYQMSDGDISWAMPHLQSWTSNIKTQISRDKSFQENHTDVTETFLANACPNECNSHGRCINGTCVCNHGFGSSDCSIDLTAPPPLSGIYNDGQCDTSVENCSSGFSIYGDDFIRSESLECEVERNEIDMMGTILSRDLDVTQADFVSLFEVICPVNRNSLSKSTKSPTAKVYNFSVSNFGQNFGKKQAMTVIDQRCTLMKPNNSFSLKPGHCYINGVCYADGENNPTVNCQACASVVNPYDWSSKWSMECSENGACPNGPPFFFFVHTCLVTVLVQRV